MRILYPKAGIYRKQPAIVIMVLGLGKLQLVWPQTHWCTKHHMSLQYLSWLDKPRLDSP